MALKFPNARLLIHQLIVSGEMSGPQALATAASEYGLISAEAVGEVQVPTDSDACKCMATARQILIRHLEDTNRRPGHPVVNPDEVWAAVERATEPYREHETADTQAQNHNNNHNHNHNGSGDKDPHQCLKFVPKLFDIMLQQIGRYR